MSLKPDAVRIHEGKTRVYLECAIHHSAIVGKYEKREKRRKNKRAKGRTRPVFVIVCSLLSHLEFQRRHFDIKLPTRKKAGRWGEGGREGDEK